MADEQSQTEHETRRLLRAFAQEPLPDPPLSDEALAQLLRARLEQERAVPDGPANAPRAPDQQP